jgi:hypothetical protein
VSAAAGFDEADWLAAPFAARAFLLNMLAAHLETHKEALFEAIETCKSVKVIKPLHERYRVVKELSDLFSALEREETATRDQVDDSVPPGKVRFTFELVRQSEHHHDLAQFVSDNHMQDLVKVRWSE